MSNGRDVADSVIQGTDLPRPGKALADSLMRELHPDAVAPKPVAESARGLADSLMSDLKRHGYTLQEEPQSLSDRLISGLIIEPLKDVSDAVLFSLTGTVPGEKAPIAPPGLVGQGDVATSLQ